MKIKLGISIVIMLFLFNRADVAAQGNGYYRNSPNHHQGQRIHQGWKQGDLNRMEMRQLVRQQKRIKHAEREMMQDGRLSHRERKELARMRKSADRNIFLQRHDEGRKCTNRR